MHIKRLSIAMNWSAPFYLFTLECKNASIRGNSLCDATEIMVEMNKKDSGRMALDISLHVHMVYPLSVNFVIGN